MTKRERLRRLEQRLMLARLPGEVTVILTSVPRNPDDATGAARMAVSEWR